MSSSTPSIPSTATENVAQSPSLQFPQAPDFILNHDVIIGAQTMGFGGTSFCVNFGGEQPPGSRSGENNGGRSLSSFPQAPGITLPATDMAMRNPPIDPPRQKEPKQSGKAVAESEIKAIDTRLCALELICYRSSAEGCIKGTVVTAQADKFNGQELLQMRVAQKKKGYALITDNEMLFKEIRRVYERKMCSFWRRWFSLTKVKSFVILRVIKEKRPTPFDLGDEFERELLWYYYNPSKAPKNMAYIEWVFKLRGSGHRHALQVVEGWSSLRIATAGSMPVVISSIVGIAWSARTGDVVSAFTVALFILTAGTLLIAVLGIICSVATPK